MQLLYVTRKRLVNKSDTLILIPLPENEIKRLQALHSLNILDTPPDARLDCITRFVAQKLEIPICLITLIDAYRQWFKSVWGIDGTEVPRSVSICAHAIFEVKTNEPNSRIFEIYDIQDDVRFFGNPLVKNKNGLRSYISYVLQSESGQNIGTLCLVGTDPRKYTESEKKLIILIGQMAENIINGYYFSKGIEEKLY